MIQITDLEKNRHLNMDSSNQTTHNMAYLCFLPATFISLVSGLTNLIPIDTGTAGGIGFLILIPLALLALVSIPMGIMLSFRNRQDYVLLILSFLTVLYVAEILTEAGSVKFYNTILFLYGILSMLLLLSWFLFRRKRYYR